MVSYSFFKNTVLFSFILMAACGNSVKGKINKGGDKIVEIIDERPEISGIREDAKIKTGADNYENYLPLLKDKKVGIVTNQTGTIIVDGIMQNDVDFLLSKKSVN